MTNTHFKHLRCTIDSSQIGFLKFLLEGYDGMTTLSTIDRHEGIIFIRYANCFEAQLFTILDDFILKDIPTEFVN